jgi:2-polyprenyl-3-methyl-5-hydroxy-6-metoxy-1,4-benzoquinol methylase
MKLRIMDIIICPKCGSDNLMVEQNYVMEREYNDNLSYIRCQKKCSYKQSEISEGLITTKDCNNCYRREIIKGKLYCECGKVYPIHLGIPRLFPEKTVDEYEKIQKTFSYEWKMFKFGERNWGQDITYRKNLFLKGMGVSPNKLENKIIFDAGCGSGMLSMEMANSFGMEVIALDLAFGIEKAYNYNKNPNLHFIQGSVLSPPIKPNTFDYIYCAGVLVHLPDTKIGFRKIIKTIKLEGRCFIWVYHPINKTYHPNDYKKIFIYNWIREHITSKLPISLQYYIFLSTMPVFLMKQKMENILGYRNDLLTGGEKMQALFDMFSPIYQNRHTHEEIIELYKEEGFKNMKISDLGPYGFGVYGDFIQ